jgi:hypothetical protein
LDHSTETDITKKLLWGRVQPFCCGGRFVIDIFDYFAVCLFIGVLAMHSVSSTGHS